jgi:hypothetical protein
MNTIRKRERKLFPRSGKLLYSVASADSASIGFSSGRKTRVGSCRTWKMKWRSWKRREQQWRLP